MKVLFYISLLFILVCCNKDNPAKLKSDEKKILSFSIKDVNFSIDHNKKEIKGTLPFGTDLTKLVAKFTISDKATLKVNNKIQVSGVTSNDFSPPPPPTKYVVIAENETTSIYTVIIELEKNDKAQILEFTIDNVPFSIDNNKKEIKGSLPYGTDPTKLIATFKISQKASLEVNKIVQKSGQTINDFTNTVTYQVISENGKNKLYYKVIVKLEKNNEANILGFMINSLSIVFSVNQGSKKIQAPPLPYGTDIY